MHLVAFTVSQWLLFRVCHRTTGRSLSWNMSEWQMMLLRFLREMLLLVSLFTQRYHTHSVTQCLCLIASSRRCRYSFKFAPLKGALYRKHRYFVFKFYNCFDSLLLWAHTGVLFIFLTIKEIRLPARSCRRWVLPPVVQLTGGRGLPCPLASWM